MIEYMLNESRRDNSKSWLRTDTTVFVLMMASCAVLLAIFAAVVL